MSYETLPYFRILSVGNKGKALFNLDFSGMDLAFSRSHNALALPYYRSRKSREATTQIYAFRDPVYV